AGVEALRDGGNAFDAAVTAAAVCAVVLPARTSIGGDLFALVHDARSRTTTAFNGSGRSPKRLSADGFPDGFPERGPQLLTVPGVLAAWSELPSRHGTFDLTRALDPAIRYAEEGFPVSDVLAAGIAAHRDVLSADPGCAATFLPRGRAPRPGEVLTQPDLARSLQLVAEHGAEVFYRGEMGWGSADLVHLMVEAKKLAFADRDAVSGDVPGFDPKLLITADRAAERRLQIGGKAADHTTYLGAIDRDGNAVSLIESIFSEFGAAFLAPGTGIVANNSLTGFY